MLVKMPTITIEQYMRLVTNLTFNKLTSEEKLAIASVVYAASLHGVEITKEAAEHFPGMLLSKATK